MYMCVYIDIGIIYYNIHIYIYIYIYIIRMYSTSVIFSIRGSCLELWQLNTLGAQGVVALRASAFSHQGS